MPATSGRHRMGTLEMPTASWRHRVRTLEMPTAPGGHRMRTLEARLRCDWYGSHRCAGETHRRQRRDQH